MKSKKIKWDGKSFLPLSVGNHLLKENFKLLTAKHKKDILKNGIKSIFGVSIRVTKNPDAITQESVKCSRKQNKKKQRSR